MIPVDWVLSRARRSARLFGDALGRRPFLRNVAVVFGGNAAAQGIVIAFSPVLTRLYGPEAYGVFGVFLSVASVAAPLACLAYEHAIVLPADDMSGVRLLGVSFGTAILTSLMALALIIPFRGWIADRLGLIGGAAYLLAVPVAMFFTGVAQALDQWLIRTRQFGASSRIAIAQQLVVNAGAAALGVVTASPVALVGTYVLGRVIQAVLSGKRSWRSLVGAAQFSEPGPFTLSRLGASIIWQYHDFPLYRAPQLALASLSQNAPTVLLAAYLGPVGAGLYIVGRRVIMLPAAVVQQAVSKVFVQRIAEGATRSEDLRRLIVKATVGLAAVGVIPFGLIAVTGPNLFGFVFGPEWVRAGEYARWMAIWALFSFANCPSVMAVPVLALQGHYLIFQAVTEAARVGGLVLALSLLHDDLLAIALYSAIGAAANVVLILSVIHFSAHRRRMVGTAQLSPPAADSAAEA